MGIFKNLVLQWTEWQGVRIVDGTRWKITEFSDPIQYIQLILQVIIGLAGIVSAALIIFGAYTLITSSGELENIAKGQKMITAAIIGLVIAAIAFLIVNFVIDFVPPVT